MAVPILHDGQLHGFAGFSTVSHLVSWDEADTAILTVFAELASRTIVREQRAKSIVQLATAVQQSRDGIIIADLNGVIEYVNPAIERMTGYATAELLGRELKEFVPTDDDRNSHPSLWPSVRQGLPWHGQLALTRRDGTGYHEDCKISPIRNSDGELTAFLAIKRDITDRVQLEAQLRQAQKLESIGQLAAGIAHEINTPTQYVGDNTRFLQEAFGELGELASELASLVAPGAAGDALGPENLERLRGRLQEADAEFLLEEVPSAISQSLEGIERIRSIVLAMREFAHPGSNKKEPTDVNDGVRNTVTISRNVWKYDCELTLQLDPDMPLVPCDVAEINQAILNLITNAAYAIKESREAAGTEDLGVLTIATRSIGEWAEILISDTGTGIPAGIRERIFDPFFTTKEVGLGTGQGLAIVRNLIVDKHGGEIDLESQEGQGTTFRIRLPLS
jgi:PAS domain S-box-containing protein